MTPASGTSDVTHEDFADWVLRVKRDRSDIGIPAGTLLVARRKTTISDGEVAIVLVNDEHVLRRGPVSDGPIVGVVTHVVVEAPDGG